MKKPQITIQDLDDESVNDFVAALEAIGELYSNMEYVNGNSIPVFLPHHSKAVEAVYYFMEAYEDEYLTLVEGFDFEDHTAPKKPSMEEGTFKRALEFINCMVFNNTHNSADHREGFIEVLNPAFIKSLLALKSFLVNKTERVSHQKVKPEIVKAAKTILKMGRNNAP